MLGRVCVTLGGVALLLVTVKWFLSRARRKNTIGIFHLYCSSGGGGERVLWHTVRILLDRYPTYTIYIYTQKDLYDDSLQILSKARDLFKIDLLSDGRAIERLEFVPLSLSSLVEAKKYPFLTLLMQNFMSILVAIQAAYYIIPEVYLETIGFTYTLPVFKFSGSTVIAYVHYPTISSDMIHNVLTSSHAAFNNREIFVRSSFMRRVKLIYYKTLAYLYGFAGRRADLVMVNSSWTKKHIESLWKISAKVVYPPCDVDSFKSLKLDRFGVPNNKKGINVISIAQFRPEKNHEMQIEAFDMFLNSTNCPESRLTLYGGCRDDSDHKRVKYLKDLIHRLDLSSRVDIIVNASFEKLLDGLREADAAIHTMANEHFGIVILEFMAAGLITVAHNSGGPKADIIDNEVDGYLASEMEDFADTLEQIRRMSCVERQMIRTRAVKKSDQFSVRVFESSFIKLADKYFTVERARDKIKK